MSENALMKKTILAAILSVACVVSLSAEAGRGRWGLMFGLADILSVDAYADGYQAGAGIKLSLKPDFALRGLLSIDHNSQDSTSRTALGLGAAGEWHFAEGTVSPYAGGLVGSRFLWETGQDSAVDFYFGGLFGVEARIVKSLALFAEYDLVASFDGAGFSIRLGPRDSSLGGAQVGFIVYF